MLKLKVYEFWFIVGSQHLYGHEVFVVTTEQLLDFAEMAGIECVVIDKDINPQAFRNELRLNDLAWKLL